MSERMHIVPLQDNVWLLDDAGESTCYVIVGTEKAMVVDTCNGVENLQDIVRTITQLPLIVVNTHGHCDHIFGNPYFDEAWMHREDEALAASHFSWMNASLSEEMKKPYDLQPCPFRWMEIGQVFDLGGENLLEVVSLKGHTQGSIGLLDRKRRILFSGDGCNTHIWMQLEESAPIAELYATLQALKAEHGADFDKVLCGHEREKPLPAAEIIDALMQGCEEIMRGETQQDVDYTYFAGTCKQHRISKTDPNRVIVYNAE